jgi:hypothetical protein
MRILPFTLMRDPEPDPDPSFQIKLKTLKKYSNMLLFPFISSAN